MIIYTKVDKSGKGGGGLTVNFKYNFITKLVGISSGCKGGTTLCQQLTNESCKRGGKHIGKGLDENCPTSGNQTQPPATPYSVDVTLGYPGQAKLVINR